MSTLNPIRNEAEYKQDLRAVSTYFDVEPALGTPEAEQFEMLLVLIETYESKYHVITPSDQVMVKTADDL